MKTVRRVEDTAGGTAAAEREGITAWANAQWTGSNQREADEQEYAGEGLYVFSEEEDRVRRRNGGEVFTAPDGYVRRSPVQELVIPPGYERKRKRKVLLAVFGVVLAVLAVYLLFRLQVFRL